MSAAWNLVLSRGSSQNSRFHSALSKTQHSNYAMNQAGGNARQAQLVHHRSYERILAGIGRARTYTGRWHHMSLPVIL